MNDLMSNILVGISDEVANLQLPDPMLRDFYQDEASRIFWLNTDINETSLDLVRMIINCNKEDKDKPVEERVPIKIFINSNGGDVQVMLTIVKAIYISKTPVYTVNFCNAMSAAAEILAAGHKRYALPGTCVMVHSGSCFYGGTMEQAESYKKYVDILTKRATETFLANTKIESKVLKKKGASDWYMTEDDAMQYGVIDEVITNMDILF